MAFETMLGDADRDERVTAGIAKFAATYVRAAPVLIFLVFFCSSDFDLYLLNLHLRELGVMLNVSLFALLVVIAPVSFRTLLRVALLPAAALFLAMLTWSVIFQINTGYSFVPSFAAMRFWLLFLMAPNLYLSYRMGVSFHRLGNAFLSSLTVTGALFSLIYLVVPLDSFKLSSDPDVARLVAVDDWRGSRLMEFPLGAMTFGFFYSVLILFRRPFRLSRIELALVPAMIYLYALTFSRFITAAAIAAAIVYVGLFRIWGRLRKLVAPLALGAMLASVAFVLSFSFAILNIYSDDPSLITRLSTLLNVAEGILKYPIFGMGQDSNYSLSYRDLFGNSFNVGDAGIAGLVFQFGVAGLIVYTSMIMAASSYVVNSHLAARGTKEDYLMRALLLYTIFIVIMSVVSPMSIYETGSLMIAYVFGFSFIALDAKVDHKTKTNHN